MTLKPYSERPTTFELILLLAILLLAAVLRLGAPGVVEFKRDEANLSLMALDMARGKEFPLLGIDSSVGIRNAPVNVWIMAVPYLFSSDPEVATQFVALLNVIGVAMVYALARRYYGVLVAVIAGLTFAVAPWSVIYSRKIWAQDLLPLFVIATVFTGLLGFVEGKRWGQWLHLPLLAITGQIHYVTFVLIPITLYLIVSGRRKLTRAFYLSIALMILVTLPYAIGAIRASLLKPDVLARIVSGQNSAVDASEKASGIALTGAGLEYAWFTVAGTNLHSITGVKEFQNFLPIVEGSYLLFDLLGIAIVGAAAWLAIRAVIRCDARTSIDVALLLWLLVTPLIFSITWTPAYPHYMIPIFPAAYLILGAGIGDLARGNAPRVRRLAAVGLVGLLTVIAALQVRAVVELHSFVNATMTTGGFGTPLGYLSPLRTTILEQNPAHLIAHLDGQFIGYHEDTTVWNFLLYEVADRRFVDDMTEVYPADPAAYLSHECGADTQNFLLRSKEEGCYTVSTRSQADYDASTFTAIPQPQPFDNGATITAYRWEAETGCLSVAWTTDRGPVTPDFSMAVQFTNANGEKIADADGLSYRGQFWRAGDVVVRKFCMQWGQERIPEIAGVRLGFYTVTDTAEGQRFDNASLLDAAGNPAGQMVEVRFGE